MVKNKELQESRIRGYFIEAAKETLKGEGLKAVNVRTVSERAGYSFATLYNYFKDLNELVFICVSDFMDDCETSVDEHSARFNPGQERLKARMKATINYFIQYPGIFELFFVERMNDLGSGQPTARTIYEFTDRIVMDDIRHMTGSGEVSSEDEGLLKMNLRNSMAGLLLFYNNRLQPSDYEEFISIVEKQIDLSLRLCVKHT
ncbi:MAG: TetR/AcrR family transcriptional regulator [Bacteroidales bacterium]|nr:TetR/AcrR family transcriptional regulator [Bacteroidales bacterium]